MKLYRLLVYVLFIISTSFYAQYAQASSSILLEKEDRIVVDFQSVMLCSTDDGQFVDLSVSDPCEFKPIESNKAFARGLSHKSTWVQVSLTNHEPTAVTRWISMATPRIESIAVYEDRNQKPVLIGARYPMAERAIQTTIPVVPVTLNSYETKTLLIAFKSQTFVDASMTIWQPEAFQSYQSKIHFFQSVGMGGLLLGMMFSFMIYAIVRDVSFIYFGLALLGSFTHEFQQSGFMLLLGWPSDLAFYTPMIAIATALSTVFYTAFIHTFIDGLHHKFRSISWFIIGIASIVILSILYSIFFDFQSGVWIWSIGIFVLLISGIISLIWVWYKGLRSAGLIVLSFVLVMFFEGIKVLFLTGNMQFSMIHNMLGPWTVLIVTPLVLLAIGFKNKELQAELIQSKELLDIKTSFVKEVNHEIRAPLNRVINAAQNISNKEVKNVIIDQSKFILSIVDEALKYQNLKGKRSYGNFSVVDWHKFINQLEFNCNDIVYDLFKNHNNRFSFIDQSSGIELIYLDYYKISQVIDNLVNNAAKYCQSSDIDLVVDSFILPYSSDPIVKIEFLIFDNGNPISTEDESLIFMPFTRGSNADKSGIDGQGMGLAIVKQLVDQMNIMVEDNGYKNSVWLTSLPDQKCFGVTLYAYLATEQSEQEHDELIAVLSLNHKKKILDLVKDGDISEIVCWSDSLMIEEPELTEFAEKVKFLALTLKMKELKKLVSVM